MFNARKWVEDTRSSKMWCGQTAVALARQALFWQRPTETFSCPPLGALTPLTSSDACPQYESVLVALVRISQPSPANNAIYKFSLCGAFRILDDRRKLTDSCSLLLSVCDCALGGSRAILIIYRMIALYINRISTLTIIGIRFQHRFLLI